MKELHVLTCSQYNHPMTPPQHRKANQERREDPEAETKRDLTAINVNMKYIKLYSAHTKEEGSPQEQKKEKQA